MHITEQQIPEHNLIFDLITTTVPNKETSEVVAEGRHKPSETNITLTTSVSITYIQCAVPHIPVFMTNPY